MSDERKTDDVHVTHDSEGQILPTKMKQAHQELEER